MENGEELYGDLEDADRAIRHVTKSFALLTAPTETDALELAENLKTLNELRDSVKARLDAWLSTQASSDYDELYEKVLLNYGKFHKLKSADATRAMFEISGYPEKLSYLFENGVNTLPEAMYLLFEKTPERKFTKK